MKRRVIAIASILLVVLFVCVGCGDPTIDTSTTKNFQESMKEVTAKLSDAKKEKFKEAMVSYLFLKTMTLIENGMSEDEAKVQVEKSLDGKTAEDVIKLAEELGKE